MPLRSPPIGYVAPMLPSLVDAAPEGSDWIHEVKYDGYRTEIAIDGARIQAFTRNGHDWTERYGPVVRSARALHCRSALIDGEMCVQNPDGITNFGAMRRSIKTAPERLVLFAFDLLALDGHDLRDAPLIDRRRRLQDLVGIDPPSRIHFSGDHAGEGATFFKAAETHGLEGIVSKRADSRYVGGRTKAWLKIKSFTVGNYSVIGVERSPTGRAIALLATAGKNPSYVGDAVVSLTSQDHDAFWSDVAKLGTPQSRLRGGVMARRQASWVREGLVARVRHLRGEDKLRHATIESVGQKSQREADVADRHPEDE